MVTLESLAVEIHQLPTLTLHVKGSIYALESEITRAQCRLLAEMFLREAESPTKKKKEKKP